MVSAVPNSKISEPESPSFSFYDSVGELVTAF